VTDTDKSSTARRRANSTSRRARPKVRRDGQKPARRNRRVKARRRRSRDGRPVRATRRDHVVGRLSLGSTRGTAVVEELARQHQRIGWPETCESSRPTEGLIRMPRRVTARTANGECGWPRSAGPGGDRKSQASSRWAFVEGWAAWLDVSTAVRVVRTASPKCRWSAMGRWHRRGQPVVVRATSYIHRAVAGASNADESEGANDDRSHVR